MQCNSPVRIRGNLDPVLFPDGLLVPCGKCLQCRISKRREWSMRCLHELSDHEESVFVTLTYDERHLPFNGSVYPTLRKSDLQKFFKRLRKRLGERRIRYYACGEYGEHTQRPHYHAIIFGLGLSDEDKQLVMDSWPLCDWSVYAIRSSAFGLAEPDSIRYVAQYIDKKFSGEEAEREYAQKMREPVFRLQSLGIGRGYCDSNRDQFVSALHCTVRGVRHSLPRYYVERLGIPRELLREHAQQVDIDQINDILDFKVPMELTRDEAYRLLPANDVRRIEEAIDSRQRQRGKNLEAKLSLKSRKKI